MTQSLVGEGFAGYVTDLRRDFERRINEYFWLYGQSAPCGSYHWGT
jgi:hypothetical protein